MKILFLSDSFPPDSLGGAEIASFNLAKTLANKGHDLLVVTTVQDKDKAGEEKYQGLKVFKIYVKEYHPIFTNYLSLWNPSAFRQVEKIVKEVGPDIIHAQNIHHYLSYHCLKVARKYAKGVFLTAHDTMLISCGKFFDCIDEKNLSIPKQFDYKVNLWKEWIRWGKSYNPFRNLVIRYYLKYVDKIFTITDVVKDALYQNKITNVETVHYGTDMKLDVDDKNLDEFKSRLGIKDKKVILFGGRLSEHKGGRKTLEMLKYVIEKDPNTILLVVGVENDYAKYMERLAQAVGLEDAIIFTGWIDRSQMNFAYASADVVITPSLYLDAFNLFNLEAMAVGKPVVGTCFGGTPEIIEDNKTGYVVNPYHTEMFGDRVLDILSNKDKARQFGETGKERVSKYFTLDMQAEKTLHWYKKFTN